MLYAMVAQPESERVVRLGRTPGHDRPESLDRPA